ncbi:MAG: phosphate ABC transporter substrate-binding protein PstS [bacterium]
MAESVSRLARLSMPALFVLAAGVAACTRDSSPPSTATRINIAGAGATFPYPLYRVWFARYGDSAGVSINYFSVGSAEGLRLFGRGEVDFGAVDSRLRPKVDESRVGCGQVAVPMVQGAVAVAYNLPSLGNAVLVLNAPTLAGIYRGQLTKWNAVPIANLNRSLKMPDLPITVVRRASGSGTGRAFSEYLRTSGQWLPAAGEGDVRWPVGIAAEGNQSAAADVQVSIGAIGFMELTYARQNRLPIAALVDSVGDPVQPGTSTPTYPVRTQTWLLFDPARLTELKGKALVGFARWALRDGAATAAGLEYDALPKDTIAHYDSLLAGVDFKRCARTPAQ